MRAVREQVTAQVAGRDEAAQVSVACTRLQQGLTPVRPSSLP